MKKTTRNNLVIRAIGAICLIGSLYSTYNHLGEVTTGALLEIFMFCLLWTCFSQQKKSGDRLDDLVLTTARQREQRMFSRFWWQKVAFCLFLSSIVIAVLILTPFQALVALTLLMLLLYICFWLLPNYMMRKEKKYGLMESE